jgi:hypothetical protein
MSLQKAAEELFRQLQTGPPPVPQGAEKLSEPTVQPAQKQQVHHVLPVQVKPEAQQVDLLQPEGEPVQPLQGVLQATEGIIPQHIPDRHIQGLQAAVPEPPSQGLQAPTGRVQVHVLSPLIPDHPKVPPAGLIRVAQARVRQHRHIPGQVLQPVPDPVRAVPASAVQAVPVAAIRDPVQAGVTPVRAVQVRVAAIQARADQVQGAVIPDRAAQAPAEAILHLAVPAAQVQAEAILHQAAPAAAQVQAEAIPEAVQVPAVPVPAQALVVQGQAAAGDKQTTIVKRTEKIF